MRFVRTLRSHSPTCIGRARGFPLPARCRPPPLPPSHGEVGAASLLLWPPLASECRWPPPSLPPWLLRCPAVAASCPLLRLLSS
eukprot:4216442-Lingulodinium_polyedra.AAC.1